MSGITKVNKSNLDSAITTLSSKVKEYDTNVQNISGILTSIPAHSDFPGLTTKASMVSRSLSNIGLDLNHVSKNMKTYLDVLKEIDAEGFDLNATEAEQFFDTSSDNNSDSVVNNSSSTNTDTNTNTNTSNNNSSDVGTVITTTTTTLSGSNNWSSGQTNNSSSSNISSGSNNSSNSGNSSFPSSSLSSSDYEVPAGGKYNYEGIEEHLEDVEGNTITLPEGLGNIHTYMGWQCITAVSSKQYKLRTAAGMNFDKEGFARIGDRYVVATTTTFGNVGDFIDVYQEDGTIIKCVIGDIKSQGDAGCTKWGHNNGRCVVEFVVDKGTWYRNGGGAHSNPGTDSCHPEWNQNIDKIVNKGNFFELIKTDAAQFDKTFKTVEDATGNIVNIANKLDNGDETLYSKVFESKVETNEAMSSEFITYIGEKSGYIEKGVIPKYTTATEGVDWFKEKSTFKTEDYTPKTGDIAFYDTNGDGKADYSGIIISTSGSNFTTLEGSVTDNVRKATYTTNNSKIVGYGVPDYAMLLLAKEDEERESN